MITPRAALPLLLAVLMSLSCNKDPNCGPRDLENADLQFYAYGSVQNFLTKESISGAQLFFMDQIGGSEILKLDTSRRSGQEGCFTFENVRDRDMLESYFSQNPPLTYRHLNQTIKVQDPDYFYLYSQQGENQQTGRFTYNSIDEVILHVTPAAKIKIIHDTSAEMRYHYQWEFQRRELDYSLGPNRYALINREGFADIPAETPLQISIFDTSVTGDPKLLHQTVVQADWRSTVEIQF